MEIGILIRKRRVLARDKIGVLRMESYMENPRPEGGPSLGLRGRALSKRRSRCSRKRWKASQGKGPNRRREEYRVEGRSPGSRPSFIKPVRGSDTSVSRFICRNHDGDCRAVETFGSSLTTLSVLERKASRGGVCGHFSHLNIAF